MTKMENAAHTVINTCLNVQKGESILILYNSPHDEIVRSLFSVSSKKTKNAFSFKCANVDIMESLLTPVARLISGMDVVIMVTTPSISHTEARRRACNKGARVISMPNISDYTFTRLAKTDYIKLGRKSRKLRDILTMAKEAIVRAPNGTELLVPIRRKKGYADVGILNKPGSFSNLPAGEACIAPDEGLTQGTLVVDSGMGVTPQASDKLILSIKNGKAHRISGGAAANRLRRKLSAFGSESRIVAEFGIGTNDAAKLSGYSLEDEKVLGTIHLAIGNNVSFGGSNNVGIHLDGVVYNATVEIDGKKILDNGKYILE